MQWSSASSSSVLKKETAEKSVLEFVPQKFDLGTPVTAMGYLDAKKHGSDFKMGDATRVQTGVDSIESQSEAEKIEVLAVEKLKEIQEEAYKEAYELGREEGRAEAYKAADREIKERLEIFDHSLTAIANMKKEVLAFNESHMITLLFHMASKIARSHLEANKDSMLDILRSAIGLAADEEKITVQVSALQFEFIEELQKSTGREFEFLKKIKFEPNESISPGGCIVETNYGVVDSQVEQRVEQLWISLQENMPRVKESLAG